MHAPGWVAGRVLVRGDFVTGSCRGVLGLKVLQACSRLAALLCDACSSCCSLVSLCVRPPGWHHAWLVGQGVHALACCNGVCGPHSICCSLLDVFVTTCSSLPCLPSWACSRQACRRSSPAPLLVQLSLVAPCVLSCGSVLRGMVAWYGSCWSPQSVKGRVGWQ